MFSRYSICAAPGELAVRFKVEVPEGYKPSYNAAPSNLLPVIAQDSPKGLSFFYWGTSPAWANNKPLGEKIINTRAELFAEKMVLKKRLREKRCLIPADGFYGWKKTGKKASIPYRFTRKDKALFSMAGLWEEYDSDGETFHTFSVITTAGDEKVPPFNERIPLILSHDDEGVWMNSTDEPVLTALLVDHKIELEFYSVGRLINSTSTNDKRVIMPAPAADQFGNLSLFD